MRRPPPSPSQPILRCYTVWKFKAVTVPQDDVVAVRASEPMDYLYQHEYQRVLWRGLALNREDALARMAVAQ